MIKVRLNLKLFVETRRQCSLSLTTVEEELLKLARAHPLGGRAVVVEASHLDLLDVEAAEALRLHPSASQPRRAHPLEIQSPLASAAKDPPGVALLSPRTKMKRSTPLSEKNGHDAPGTRERTRR